MSPSNVEVQAAMTAITMLTREHRARYGGATLPSLEAEAVAVLEAAEAVRGDTFTAEEVAVTVEDVRRAWAPVPGHVLLGGEWWKWHYEVLPHTVMRGGEHDEWTVCYQRDGTRRRVVVLVPLASQENPR